MPILGPIAFETYGKLNNTADNCVLLPTYYAGTDKSYLPMLGTDRALNPAHWFIVIPNMLGNGVSSSPSNDACFTNATIADNIRAQHALLTHLGVQRIALIHGWSMGAMQGYAWAAMYPDMVRALLAVCGTAKCWPLNYAFLEAMHATMPAGRRAFGRAYAPWAYSAQFFRDELWRSLGFSTLDDFLTFWEDDHETVDARDLLAMLWTWQHADLPDLSAIKARVITMPCDTDMYFTVEEARLETAMIPGAELRVLTSPYGHCAGAPGRFASESTFIENAISELL